MYLNSTGDMTDSAERDKINETSFNENNNARTKKRCEKVRENVNSSEEERDMIPPLSIGFVPSERNLLPQSELLDLECPRRSTGSLQVNLLSHSELPEWLRGNEFLTYFHRPPMPSFRSCFKSIFKIHSETGNIWTHLIGFVIFVCITSYMLLLPTTASTPFPKNWQERLIFACFFAGAIFCLGVSWIFHTVYCHSKVVSKIFRR